MNRKENYRDMNKWRDTCRRQNRRYYRKTQAYSEISNRRKWTQEEDSEILRRDISDRELALKLKRSMSAIQIRRSRLKNSVSQPMKHMV